MAGSPGSEVTGGVVLRRPALGHLADAIVLMVLALVIARAQHRLWWHYPVGVDLEIPLRAAQRWLAGGQPYPAAAFRGTHGVDLPFLYPPFVLPMVAPFSSLPRAIVIIPWLLLLVGVAYASMRGLGFGPLVAGLALLWPPFTEALLGGNVQILLFAAFVALMYRSGRQLDPRDRERPAVVDGVLGAFVGAVKVSQIHAWLYVLRRRPQAAILGLALFALVAIVTLPLVGTQTWVDWLAQAGRASDPAWGSIGFPLLRFVGRPIGLFVTALSFTAVFIVPPRTAGAWIGILAVVGSPSLHIFGLLFLLPAMRLVPRMIGLLAAILIASYVWTLIWIAVLLVAVALVVTDRDLPLRGRITRFMPEGWITN